MFEMGSTIAIVFECPQDYELNINEGQKLILGQEILSQVIKPAPYQPETSEF